jgi:hypothetical protein
VVREFGDNNAAGTPSRKHSENQQGYLSDSYLAETLEPASGSAYGILGQDLPPRAVLERAHGSAFGEQTGNILLILNITDFDPQRSSGRIRRTAVMEYLARMLLHSGLMLAARITLPHFSVSSAMSLPKSAGEPTSGVLPRSASRALILESRGPR